MPRSAKEVQTEKLLERLKSEMHSALLWSDTRPSEWAMNSVAPFACDRMPFEHWLQFIFLPQMLHLLVTKQPLPTEMGVYPMAQQTLNKRRTPTDKIMQILADLDRLLSGAIE